MGRAIQAAAVSGLWVCLLTACGNKTGSKEEDTEDVTAVEAVCIPFCEERECGPDGCGETCGECPTDHVCLSDGICLCVPDCELKMCGDNGCGAQCGDCPGGYNCVDGMCIAEDCKPDCAAKACGADGCGGDCGGCEEWELCTSAGACVCIPDCEDKECGTDGCGGWCGQCGASASCKAGICVEDPCQPQCDEAQCGDDGCGGDCGECGPNQVCSQGQCLCIPDCGDKSCGDDGCGGSCGACQEGWLCQAGQCLCQPQCEGKTCGPDGCGGECGVCEEPQKCIEGQCGCLDKAGLTCCSNEGALCWVDSCGTAQDLLTPCPYGCLDGACQPCVPDCTDKKCGPDGCLGICGICSQSFSCGEDGTCVQQPCEPDCGAKACGNDGCGGTCGECTDGKNCVDGWCKCVAPDHVGCCEAGDGLCMFDSCGVQTQQIIDCLFGCLNGECGECSPDCEEMECGEDGCGGSCGQCGPLFQCVEGACACESHCAGKQCGPDGCGGSCGQCNPGWLCESQGQCVCMPQCGNKQCGPDGCGGQCGACPDGFACEGEACIAEPCVPDCEGKTCGPDGCGGKCGQCDPGWLCDSEGQCVCIPECGQVLCGGDGCGGLCGQCPVGYFCENGACIQEDCQPSCDGKQCGPDGCGGKCGSCDGKDVCTSEGACLCVPSCQDKMCGPDGCGGQCGGCPSGYTCVNHVCEDDVCTPQCEGKDCGADGCSGACGECPEPGYCDSGACYDCTDEGFCNATSCPSDDNPCTLEVLDPNGECTSVLNSACDEPIQNLQRIYRGAQAYYTNWLKDPDQNNAYVPTPVETGATLPLVIGPIPVEGTCCKDLGGPDTNGNNACDRKWSVSFFSDPEWVYLNFDAGQEFRFIYYFEEIGDGAPDTPVLFEARAVGDLDCDGKPATFAVQGTFEDGADFFSAWGGLNVLARPKWITYTTEGGIEQQVPSAWPVPSPDKYATHQVLDISTADSYPGRFSEAFSNLLRICRGAKRYYGISKASVDSPGCQLKADARATLEAYEGVAPYSQQPLMQGLTPVEATCCSAYGGPDYNGDGMCDPNPDVFGTETWTDLGFKIAGQFEHIYKFKQEEEADGTFHFTASAQSDLDCDGNYSILSLQGTAESNGADGCAIYRSGVVEYKTLWYGERVVGIPLPTNPADIWPHPYAAFFGQLQEEEIPADETFESLFSDQLGQLDLLEDLVAQYWDENCSFPEFPPKTPDVTTCCSGDFEDCPIDAGAWQHPFWTAIGFAIDGPHPFIYEVVSKPAGGNAQVIFIRTSKDADCDHWMPSTLERIGMAEAYQDGTCAFIRVDGLNPKWLFD